MEFALMTRSLLYRSSLLFVVLVSTACAGTETTASAEGVPDTGGQGAVNAATPGDTTANLDTAGTDSVSGE